MLFFAVPAPHRHRNRRHTAAQLRHLDRSQNTRYKRAGCGGKKGPATKRVVGSEAAAAVAHRSEEVDQPGLLPVRREVVGSQSRHVSADAVPRKAHNVVEHIFTCRTGATDC